MGLAHKLSEQVQPPVASESGTRRMRTEVPAATAALSSRNSVRTDACVSWAERVGMALDTRCTVLAARGASGAPWPVSAFEMRRPNAVAEPASRRSVTTCRSSATVSDPLPSAMSTDSNWWSDLNLKAIDMARRGAFVASVASLQLDRSKLSIQKLYVFHPLTAVAIAARRAAVVAAKTALSLHAACIVPRRAQPPT